ncbi:hypothetical protein CR513_06552, partial [Mucuna pruriens]
IVAFMTRKRSSGSLHPFDPMIEKTLNRIRKFKNMHVGHTSDSVVFIIETDDFAMKPDFSDNPLNEPNPMENNNNRTLKELATSDVLYQPYIRSWNRPKHVSSSSDSYTCCPFSMVLQVKTPHKHLKEFHVVCSMMRLQGIPEDCIKMKAFSGKGLAISTVGDVHYMGEMKRMFLEKFFPTSRTAAIWKEICGIQQHSGKRYMSIGRDLISCALHVRTIKSANNCCYSTSMKDC